MKLWDYARRNSFSFLLISLIIVLLVPPFFEGTNWSVTVEHSTLTLVLIACLGIIFGERKHPGQALLYGVLIIALNWAATLEGVNTTAVAIRLVVFMAFWTFTVFTILTRINRMKQVNADVIAGAVSGYLLFGILGAFTAAWVELVSPGSFSIPFQQDLGDFIYYSFVTLSTLGYGDILPINQIAKTLSIAITLTGQIYLAIVIAILVGKFSSGNV